jgi:hypothetical protein
MHFQYIQYRVVEKTTEIGSPKPSILRKPFSVFRNNKIACFQVIILGGLTPFQRKLLAQIWGVLILLMDCPAALFVCYFSTAQKSMNGSLRK